MMGWSSTTGGPTRSRTAAGATRPRGSGCSRGSPRTPSGRCGRSSKPTGCSSDERDRRRASAVARAGRPGLRHRLRTACPGCTGAPAAIGSSRRSIPRCAMAARAQHQRFDGYKLSAAVTNTSKPLITAIEVAPASEQDGPQAKHLIDAQPQQRRPARVLGDTAYGTGPVRAELAEREVDVLAPVPEAPAEEGRLAKRDFHIDLDAGTVTCPAGEVAPIRTEPSGRRRASFAKARCDRCPLRQPLRRARARHAADPYRTRRAAPDRRPPSPRRPRHRRAPAPHPPADRATARPARRPLRRPQEPIHRPSQSATAGRLGRRPGQPQPDRPPPRRPPRLTSPNDKTTSPHPQTAPSSTHTQPHFFRSLLGASRAPIMAEVRCLAIVPAYNEAGAIVVHGRASLHAHAPDFDVARRRRRLDGRAPRRVRAPRRRGRAAAMPFNLGIGGAVQAGYQYALEHGYDFAVQVDGDGQHDPRHIPELLAAPARRPGRSTWSPARASSTRRRRRLPLVGLAPHRHPHLRAGPVADHRPAGHRPDVGLPA